MGKLYQTQARGAKAEQAFSIARLLIEELAANISDEHVGGHFLSQAAARFRFRHRWASLWRVDDTRKRGRNIEYPDAGHKREHSAQIAAFRDHLTA